MPKKKAVAENADAAPSFEEALHELESIVRRLEQGGGALDEALTDYSQAIALLKCCHQRLEVAERRIEILSGVDAQGNPLTEPIAENQITLEEKQNARSQRRSASSGKSHGSRSPEASEDGGLF